MICPPREETRYKHYRSDKLVTNQKEVVSWAEDIGAPLQLIPPHPSLHLQDSPSSRGRLRFPSAKESHSKNIDTYVWQVRTRNIRGVRQSIPAHPGGHSHCPLYRLQLPYWPQVKAGSMQLKQGGHLPNDSWCSESNRTLRSARPLHTWSRTNI